MAGVTALVTGVGAPVGISIVKALRAAALPVRVVGVDAEPLAQGLFLVDRGHLVPSARRDPDAYFEALVEICRQEEVQILFSGWEGELPLLASRWTEFQNRTGAVLPMEPAATLAALDKWQTAHLLAVAGVGVPDSVLPADTGSLHTFRRTHPFPYVVKPRRGWGGQGLFLAGSDAELTFFLQYVPDPVVQEYLLPDDQEYTVGVFRTASGEGSAALPLRRTLAGGLSYRMESDANAAASGPAARAAAALGLTGPVNVQLRLTPAGAKVFEVNPRCSSSTCVRAAFGLNEPEWAIRHFVLHQELPVVTVRQGVCLRVWEELYLSAKEGREAQRGRYHPVAWAECGRGPGR